MEDCSVLCTGGVYESKINNLQIRGTKYKRIKV